ncbi:hypothetical protein Ahy_A07g031843 [Arachis hypogaea]|uniref:Transposase-associated domain-containing protein n=1 Tax=Arachis hypogaea TaxID=3818 RepID=A0A445C5A5_ARAHY|nr:hypothetical protein Ahy_A07g031843 [Arachis hypogaea]
MAFGERMYGDAEVSNASLWYDHDVLKVRMLHQEAKRVKKIYYEYPIEVDGSLFYKRYRLRDNEDVQLIRSWHNRWTNVHLLEFFMFFVELGGQGSSIDTVDDSPLSGAVRRTIRMTMVDLNMPTEGSQEGSNVKVRNVDLMDNSVESHEGFAIKDPMMDQYEKYWVNFDRRSPEFRKYLDELFLDIAFSQPGVKNQIRCLCPECNNFMFKIRNKVHHHVRQWGIVTSYKTWVYHGEILQDTSTIDVSDLNEIDCERENDSATYEMLYNIFRGETLGETPRDFATNVDENIEEEPHQWAKRFQRLMRDYEQSLYPDSGISRLSFIVKLFQMKYRYGWSNNSVDALLLFLKSIFPKENSCPTLFYDARKCDEDDADEEPPKIPDDVDEEEEMNFYSDTQIALTQPTISRPYNRLDHFTRLNLDAMTSD